MSTGRRIVVIVAAVAILAGAGVGAWWFFIRDDAPPRASREAAVEGSTGAGACDTDVTVDDVQGTWTIDGSAGSVAEGTGTFAGYRIEEELASIGGQTAAGRTADVSGDLTVDGDQVTEASFEVDMTTLQSDESRRDDQLRSRGLETERFPTSTFSLTEPIDIPADAQACEGINLTATGDLDLHGVTRPVDVELDASLDGDQIVLAGSAPIVLADYDIQKPTGGPILSVADQGTFEIQFVLTQGAGASGGDTGGSGGATDSTETTEDTETSGY
jgi:polyisoprenoid-binding protein YceI